jgi:hypothetical protein
MDHFGDWSAPVTLTIRADFARSGAEVKGSRGAKRVRFALTSEFGPESAGGTVKLAVVRVLGCRRGKLRTRKASTVRGRLDARGVTLAVPGPRAGLYVGRLTFGGTRLVRPGEDPRPLVLSVTRTRFGFAGRAAPRCAQTSTMEGASHPGDDRLRRGRFVGSVASRGTGGLVKPRSQQMRMIALPWLRATTSLSSSRN